MSRIQVDLFEVQLGAALLLQFVAQPGAPVRVLADAGVKASGYPVDHVHRKLGEAFESFGDTTRRLDLVIGTHYDQDHLDGLVPIIADETIEIGEAWMPPVANDTEPHAPDEPMADRHLLVRQLAADDGAERLAAYLRAKAMVCAQVAGLQRAAEEFHAGRAARPAPAPGPTAAEPVDPHDLTAWTRLFASHLDGADATLGAPDVDLTHAGDSVIGANPLLEAEPRGGGPGSPDEHTDPDSSLPTRWRASPGTAETDAADLAAIRRATARDAINAVSLAKVVAALTARGIPIRCPVIQPGQPRHFTWDAAARTFEEGAPEGSGGPELAVLGPSDELVRKHWNRLPVGSYLARAAGLQIPILGITPSNQLSYVVRVGFAGQGILVSGDAGCVDFKAPDGEYHPALLDALPPLQLVQIAHHAGNNGHFYRALLTSGYPEPGSESLLLVSHAAHDRFRPSEEFAMFMEQAVAGSDRARIVFTSQPDSDKVLDYRGAVHPVVGEPGEVGDVRAHFKDGAWTVLRHSVAV